MLALYHNDMSLCAQKVRVCLAEKGLEWESRHLVLRAAEHQQPWYLKLNRRAVVPTLIDGDKVIPESNVILEYLDESFPEPALAPKDPYGRAKMRLWTKQLDEDIHDAVGCGHELRHRVPPAISRARRGRKEDARGDPEHVQARAPARRDRERHRLAALHHRGASAWCCCSTRWRRRCAQHHWLAGDYTLADVAFTPYLARLEHLNVAEMLGERRHVADWYRRCKARPSFQEAIVKWENADYLKLMKRARQRSLAAGAARSCMRSDPERPWHALLRDAVTSMHAGHEDGHAALGCLHAHIASPLSR